ncbi:MAG: OmpA family protein [Staphylococcus sp.]|nr:OmpA family protein [Staphylococcus sp.]
MKRILLASLVSAILALPSAIMAKSDDNNPYKGYDETVYMDMELEENLRTPEVGKPEHAAIKGYMTRLGRDLAKRNYIVDLMRNDEVILVTLPSDDIFLPNDTLLSPSAPKKMESILALCSDPYMFKVVYAVHTDNTGSPKYNMDLSHQRNNSIYDWMLDVVSEDLIVIPYEFGDTDPLVPNDSRKGRSENRRIEIFLVPGPKMIEQAQKGLLK